MRGFNVDFWCFLGVQRTQVHFTYTNMSFFRFQCVLEVGKCSALVPTFVLYCVMFVTGLITRENKNYKCVGGYEIPQVAMGSG